MKNSLIVFLILCASATGNVGELQAEEVPLVPTRAIFFSNANEEWFPPHVVLIQDKRLNVLLCQPVARPIDHANNAFGKYIQENCWPFGPTGKEGYTRAFFEVSDNQYIFASTHHRGVIGPSSVIVTETYTFMLNLADVSTLLKTWTTITHVGARAPRIETGSGALSMETEVNVSLPQISQLIME